jgi:hypothetical protein
MTQDKIAAALSEGALSMNQLVKRVATASLSAQEVRSSVLPMINSGRLVLMHDLKLKLSKTWSE